MNPLLKVTNLQFQYPYHPPTLHDVSFSLNGGEKVALVGANGAGKTTLFHLIMGLKKPNDGSIEGFGKARTNDNDFYELRTKVGILFQDPDDQLFCPTVIEDVMFGPLNLGKSRQEAKAIATKVLADLGMEGFENRITHQISGGEKRMVTLATVLAMEPEVLLLDEPTNALDTNARRRLIDALKALQQSMLIISHDHDFLDEISTRTITLNQGKIV